MTLFGNELFRIGEGGREEGGKKGRTILQSYSDRRYGSRRNVRKSSAKARSLCLPPQQAVQEATAEGI